MKRGRLQIGLQAVDGLKTSAYLLDTAKEHIERKKSVLMKRRNVFRAITSNVLIVRKLKTITKGRQIIVSARIAKLLGEESISVFTG